jgi:hypothetical protein
MGRIVEKEDPKPPVRKRVDLPDLPLPDRIVPEI